MPTHYFPYLADHVMTLVAHGGYWFMAVVVLLEAIPLVGSLIPGHVVIISAGFFAKLGILNLGAVLVVGIAAAVLGDIASFLLGRRYGYAFLQKFGKYIFLKQEHIDATKKLIDAHTGKTIILGKFSPITRAYVPFLVGASGVHIRTFWLYNIVGGALWISGSVLVGYIFGASYDVVARYLGQFIVVAIILGILIVWGYRFVNVRFHFFRKYELFVLGLNLISLFTLFKAMQDGLSRNSFLTNFDISVNIFMAERVTESVAWIASFISMIGGIDVMIALGLLAGGAFTLYAKWRRAGIMFLSVILPVFLVPIIKELFLRVRPHNALEIFLDPSFPSAHATFAAAFFVSLMYVSAPEIRSWVKREAFIVLCVLTVILIGVSRVVLSVHWASDVIAGWALGIFLATSSVLLVRYVAGLILRDNK